MAFIFAELTTSKVWHIEQENLMKTGAHELATTGLLKSKRTFCDIMLATIPYPRFENIWPKFDSWSTPIY